MWEAGATPVRLTSLLPWPLWLLISATPNRAAANEPVALQALLAPQPTICRVESPIRSREPSDLVFADDFESAALSSWSHVVSLSEPTCPEDPGEPAPFLVDTLSSGELLGTFDDCDFTVMRVGTLAPEADTEDFYRLNLESTVLCSFSLGGSLAVPAGSNYDLLLYKWNGSEWSELQSSTQGGTATELVNCGGCNVICGGCGCDACSTTGTYGFLVARSSGAPLACGSYLLTITED